MQVVAAVAVGGETEEEKDRVRRLLRDALFADRQSRRCYFSSKRIGRGVGTPPAKLEETEEFKRSGRAPPSQAPRPVNGEQQEAQDEYVKNLSEQGQLQPSISPFGAAVVMVRRVRLPKDAASFSK